MTDVSYRERLWPPLAAALAIASQLGCPIDYYDPSEERRRNERLADADGGDGSDADVADEDPETGSCDFYCQDFELVCGDAEWSLESCAEVCNSWPDATWFPDGSSPTGATLDCHLYWLSEAQSDSSLCAEADPFASTACVSDCERWCGMAQDCPDPALLWGGGDCLAACEAAFDVSCQLDALGTSEDEERCRRGTLDSCFCTTAGQLDSCFEGPACDTALDTLDHCGSCATACLESSSCGPVASEVVTTWACSAPLCEGLLCDELCLDPATDPAACGATDCGGGAVCGEGQVCNGSGQCAESCAGGFDLCDGLCRDVASDPDHCGGCGRSCGLGATCTDAICACLGTWADCDGDPANACEADLASDPLRCGDCETACAGDCSAGHCRGRIAALAVGVQHACLVDSGQVVCWGSNDAGQLGSRAADSIGAPAAVAGLDGVVDVTAGGAHTCALTADGAVYCWGSNGQGEAGQPDATEVAVPTRVADLPPATAIAAAASHTCAIGEDGQLWCWGRGVRTGEAIYGYSSQPLEVPFPALEAVGVGSDFTCGLAAGRVSCLGSNAGSRLGTASWAAELTRPAGVAELGTVLDLAAGYGHACVRRADGSVACWGESGAGQAGAAGTVTRPTPIALDAPALAVAAGAASSCAVLADGDLRCWGFGFSSPGETTRVGLAGVVEVALGDDFACAALASDTVRCWGDNEQGQLGDGTTEDSLTPVEVAWP